MDTITTTISIYAALVATATFVWRIFEWCSDKPRLVADVRTDMFMDKSKKFSILDQMNKYPNNEKGISIEITNLGKIPTTVKYIAIQPYKRIFFRKKRHVIAFAGLNFSIESSPLPVVLKPGDIWSAFYLDQTTLLDKSKEFDLVMEIHHSFSKRPVNKKLRFIFRSEIL